MANLILEYGQLALAQRRDPTVERQARLRAIERETGRTRDALLQAAFLAILP